MITCPLLGNITRSVLLDGVKNGSVVGLNKYASDAELSSVCLFRNYPDLLLYVGSVFCILFTIIGIPGNLITIYALIQYKKIRNATAIFIINLSIADLAICSVVLPITVTVFITKSWIFGKTLCRIYPLLKLALSGVSLLSIIAITINRYIIIVHPHIYHRCYNKRNIIIMIMAIWIFSFALLMPTLFEVWGRFSLNPYIGFCAMIPDENNQSPIELFMITFFFVTCTIIFICYIHIFWVVTIVVKNSGRKNKNRIINNDRDDSSDVSLHFENEKGSTKTELVVLSNNEPKLEGNNDETEPKRMRLKSSNMSKKIRKHIGSKLKEINMKQWFPTGKDKKLGTMIIAIMICFCVCYLPVMVIKTLCTGFSSYPVMVFISYLLAYSTTCLNPVIYVVMSSEYRVAYKSLLKSIFVK